MKRLDAEARAQELYIDFPEPTPLLPPLVAVAAVGDICTVAQALPVGDGRLQFRGCIGHDISVDQARVAVRLATVYALAQLRAHAGSLNHVTRISALHVQLATTPEFRDHAKTLDTASQLLADLFGAHGTHTRHVTGVTSLPEGACASVTLIVQL